MSHNQLLPRQDHVVPVAVKRSGFYLGDGLLWVLGGIALVVGLVILLVDRDQYVGLGGDFSWPISELYPAWGYGLAAAGVLSVAAALTITLRSRHATHAAIGDRAEGLAALLTHAGVFVIVNLFIWLQDLAIGDGVNYAYWVTAPWAVGLLAHAAAYLTQRRHRA